jgi:hypothetical protein
VYLLGVDWLLRCFLGALVAMVCKFLFESVHFMEPGRTSDHY